jgi:hypothetical protein
MPRRVIAPLGETLNADTSQKPATRRTGKSGWLFLFDMQQATVSDRAGTRRS